jgi:hypothetical protein
MLVSNQPHAVFVCVCVLVFELFKRETSWPAIAKVIWHKLATKAITYTYVVK